MSSTRITFPNKSGQILSAVLEQPADGQAVAHALFAHCFTCSKDLRAARHISRSLVNAGYAVLRFDFTGLGQSEGEFENTSFSTNQGDLESAFEWLKEHLEAPALLIGHSLGGTALLHTASRLEGVKAIATIGSPFDPGHVAHLFAETTEEIKARGEATVEIGGRPFNIKKSFLDDLERTDCAELVANLDAALLVMHSPIDTIVSIDNAARVFQAARHPKSFVSLNSADHLLSQEEDAKYVGAVLGAWASRYLDIPVQNVKGREEGAHQVTVKTGTDHFYTEIIANGHSLVADEPTYLGGTNLGPTPYDMLLSALGACTAITVRMYADRKEWPLEDIQVALVHSQVQAKDCVDCGLPEDAKGRVYLIERQVKLTGKDLTPDMVKRIMEIADRCPVHRTLVDQTVIKTSLVD
jgi:uncharacterized OsmC-like protein/pimeloyl-ACP methyl ester carboxylesterase